MEARGLQRRFWVRREKGTFAHALQTSQIQWRILMGGFLGIAFDRSDRLSRLTINVSLRSLQILRDHSIVRIELNYIQTVEVVPVAI